MVIFNLFWDVKVAGVTSIFQHSAAERCGTKSPAYKTERSWKIFEEWKQNRLVKSCTLETGGLFTTKDFEEGVQTLGTVITDMSACSLNNWLWKFAQEVSHSSGERYPSCSLYSVICRLKRHLSDVNGVLHWTHGHVQPKVSCIFRG